MHRVEQLQEMIEMKDLQFSGDGGRRGRGSQGAAARPGAQIGKYVPGQEMARVYADNETKLANQRQKVLLD